MNNRNARRYVALVAVAVAAVTGACDSLVTRPSLYGQVTARVKTRSGAAIGGAGLTLYTGQRPMGYAVTDASGAHTFVDVPEGVYGVLATAPLGYISVDDLSATPHPTFVAQNLRLLAQHQIDTTFTLLKLGVGTVAASVKARDGTPVPQVAVTLYTPSGAVQHAVTDAGGQYSFGNVPTGNYGVFASRPPTYLDSGETSLTSVDGIIVDDGSRESATFTFDRCAGPITATVRDSTSSPVPGAEVTLYTGAGVVDRDTTGADGVATRTGVACGLYGLRVALPAGWAAANVRGAAYVDNLRLHRGGALQATLTVGRTPRATIKVLTVDQNGNPVANTRVVLYTASGVQRDVTTGADGSVTMSEVPVSEEYGVRIVSSPGYTVTEGRGTSYVDGIRLVVGETRTLTFRLTRP